MQNRYKRRSFIETLFEEVHLTEIIVILAIFIITLGMLFLPKNVLYIISMLPFLKTI
ncbi:MAG: hypothetical protein N2712_04395 [Brevinematales bacterium]|nr:hypothetical protein [Brevinematales bacterium]